MFRNMLVPLDGSEMAEVVLPYAKELSARMDLNVTLLHVNKPGMQGLAPMHRHYVERMVEIISNQVKEVQQSGDIRSEEALLQVRGELSEGNAAEEILRYVNDNDTDLILIATHGHSGVRRWAMGSVADKVLRASKVPVLLIRAVIPEEVVYDKWPKLTILVPLDGSELAEAVLPHVEALAKQRGAELVDVILLRVCDPPFITADYPADMPLTWEEHVEHITDWFKQKCYQYLSGEQKKLESVGLNVRSEVLMGNPADEIINYTTKNPFNLVIMATHGRSGSKRWVYGSVTDKVLHGIRSPVLLVRPTHY